MKLLSNFLLKMVLITILKQERYPFSMITFKTLKLSASFRVSKAINEIIDGQAIKNHEVFVILEKNAVRVYTRTGKIPLKIPLKHVL